MRRALATLVAALFAALTLVAGPAGQAGPIRTQDDLFQRTRIWSAHLVFTADQWKAMEPVQGSPTGRSRFTGGEWLQGAPGNRNGWAATRGIEFNYVHADLEFSGTWFKDVGVRFKGNGTYNQQSVSAVKNSVKVDLNKYVKGQKLAGLSTLNFHNNIADPGFMNEVLAFQLYRDAGVPAPRSAYARVYLTVPGLYDRRYSGLYSMAENIDTNFLQARFKSDAGAILKPTTVKPFTDLGDDWTPYVQPYDPKTDLTDADKRRVIELCRLVSHATDADFNARVGTFVDISAFARYMAVVAWMNNWDSILRNGQNYYVHMDPANGRMRFFPWDQDSSWGTFQQQMPGTHATGDIFKPWPDEVRFLERMFAVPEFRTAYLARMREFSKTIFEPGRFEPQVAELAAMIRPLLPEEPRAMAGRGAMPAQVNAGFERIAKGEIGILPFARARTAHVLKQLGQ